MGELRDTPIFYDIAACCLAACLVNDCVAGAAVQERQLGKKVCEQGSYPALTKEETKVSSMGKAMRWLVASCLLGVGTAALQKSRVG